MVSTLRCRVLVLELFLLIAYVASVGAHSDMEYRLIEEPIFEQRLISPYEAKPQKQEHKPHKEKDNSVREGDSSSWRIQKAVKQILSKNKTEPQRKEQKPQKEKDNSVRGGDSSSWRIQKAVKQILSKNSDVKTIILAKDSTFNFYPGKLFAHIDIHDETEDDAVAKDNDVTTKVSIATVDGISVSKEIEQKQNGDDIKTAAPGGDDTTPSGDVKTTSLVSDVSVQTTSSESDVSVMATSSVSDVSVETTSSVSETSGTETVTEGIATDGKIEIDQFTPKPPSKVRDETNVTAEEIVFGRLRGNKYVYMRSVLPVKSLQSDLPSHLVLDVDFEDNKAEDGSRKIVLSTNDQALSEQWHIDNQTNSIRNRQKNLCISFNERNQLIASPCNATNERQWWLYDHIRRCLHNPHYDFVAEVGNAEAEVGGGVKVGAYDNNLSQHFELGTLPLYFVVVNEETGLALSVFEDRDRPGTKLVLARLQIPPTNGQLWYFDTKDTLRSRINDYVIDGSSNTFRSEPFSYEAVDTTTWTFFDRHIINLYDQRQVMEPALRENDEDTALAPKRRNDDRIGQKFKIVYNYQTDAVQTPENITTTLSGPFAENQPITL